MSTRLSPRALSLQGVRGHGALAKEKLGEQSSGHNRGTAWRRAEALLRGSPWMRPDSIHLAKPPHEPSFRKPPRLSLSRELGQPDTQSDPPDSLTRRHERHAREPKFPRLYLSWRRGSSSDASPGCPDPRTQGNTTSDRHPSWCPGRGRSETSPALQGQRVEKTNKAF